MIYRKRAGEDKTSTESFFPNHENPQSVTGWEYTILNRRLLNRRKRGIKQVGCSRLRTFDVRLARSHRLYSKDSHDMWVDVAKVE